MKKNVSRISAIISIVLFAVLVINSCKKDEPDTETQSSVDNSIAEGEFARIFPQTNSIAIGDSGVQKNVWLPLPVPTNNCPDYWIDSVDALAFPVTMWLFFGADYDGDSIYEIPYICSDGKSRQGIVKAIFSAPWFENGSSITMVLKNYFVNGIQYEGTVVVTRSANSFTQTVSNGKCTNGTQWTILWNSARTITTLMGDSTNMFDDVCLISGSADGTDRNGKTFAVEIDANNPIRREMGCPYIVKGIQTLTPEGKKARTIDFGDGTCDNKAKLIIDGNEFEFILQ